MGSPLKFRVASRNLSGSWDRNITGWPGLERSEARMVAESSMPTENTDE